MTAPSSLTFKFQRAKMDNFWLPEMSRIVEEYEKEARVRGKQWVRALNRDASTPPPNEPIQVARVVRDDKGRKTWNLTFTTHVHANPSKTKLFIPVARGVPYAMLDVFARREGAPATATILLYREYISAE